MLLYAHNLKSRSFVSTSLASERKLIEAQVRSNQKVCQRSLIVAKSFVLQNKYLLLLAHSHEYDDFASWIMNGFAFKFFLKRTKVDLLHY